MNSIAQAEQHAIATVAVDTATAEQSAIANTTITVPSGIADTAVICQRADALFNAVADVTEVIDKAGRELIHRAAMDLRELRLDAKKESVDFEKQVKNQLKELTGNVNKAIEYIQGKEDKLLSVRDAFDDKQKQIKAAIQFAETAATAAAGQSAEHISGIIERLNNTDVPHNAEFAIAKEKALSVLNTLREAAIAQEREAAEAAAKAAEAAAAQQAELARLRAMEQELIQLRAKQARAAQATQPQAAHKPEESNVVDVAFIVVKPADAQPVAQAPAETPSVLNRNEVIDMVASLYMISTKEAEAALISMFGA